MILLSRSAGLATSQPQFAVASGLPANSSGPSSVLPRAPPRSNQHNGIIQRVYEPWRTSEPNLLYR